MRPQFYIIILSLFLIHCGNTIGTPELPQPEELILGTWEVFDASIDGQKFPITNPGFGQIQTTFMESTVEHIYPKIDERGLPSILADTLYGPWYFNDDYSMVSLFDEDGLDNSFDWDVVELGVGILHTRFVERSPADTTTLSTYDIIYRLVD